MAILGASTPEQLKDTLAALEYKLEPSLKQELAALTHPHRDGDAEQ